MKKDYCHVSILLDRSGSMNSIKNDVIGGFNAFIDEQKKVPGELSVTLMSFASHNDTSIIYDAVKLDQISPLSLENYLPKGSTALNDSFVKLIEHTGMRFSNMPEEERPEKALVVCITDGEENDSKEHDTSALKNIITHQKDKYNWEFIYIGANQDSFSEAKKRGILRSSNFQANSAGTRGAYASLSADTVKYRTGQDF